jgi:UDP-N-acetyl-D-mannosaminuronate dehydrogenase
VTRVLQPREQALAPSGLAARIEARTARVGVIGQGYVGLPLALVFREAGFPVLGFDVDTRNMVALLRGDGPRRLVKA